VVIKTPIGNNDKYTNSSKSRGWKDVRRTMKYHNDYNYCYYCCKFYGILYFVGDAILTRICVLIAANVRFCRLGFSRNMIDVLEKTNILSFSIISSLTLFHFERNVFNQCIRRDVRQNVTFVRIRLEFYFVDILYLVQIIIVMCARSTHVLYFKHQTQLFTVFSKLSGISCTVEL